MSGPGMLGPGMLGPGMMGPGMMGPGIMGPFGPEALMQGMPGMGPTPLILQGPQSEEDDSDAQGVPPEVAQLLRQLLADPGEADTEDGPADPLLDSLIKE